MNAIIENNNESDIMRNLRNELYSDNELCSDFLKWWRTMVKVINEMSNESQLSFVETPRTDTEVYRRKFFSGQCMRSL